MKNKLSKRQYIEFFNYQIRFTRIVRDYLNKYVVKAGETLDTRPILYQFVKKHDGKGYISIKYYLYRDVYDEEDTGERIIDLPLAEFEEKMGWN